MKDHKDNAGQGIFALAQRLGDGLERFLEYPVLILAILVTVSVLAGVFFRYVLRAPLGWSEEFSRYIMIWMAFLSVALCIWKHEHVGVTMFIKKLPRMMAKIMIFISNGLVMLFLSVLLVYGLKMAERGKSVMATGLGTTMKWWLMAVPVSAAICIVMMVCKMILDVRRENLDEMLMSEELVDAVKREENLDF